MEKKLLVIIHIDVTNVDEQVETPSHRRLWPILLEPCEQQEPCIDGIMNWFERMMANFT